MSGFPVQCFICNITCKGDDAYIVHMQTVHETSSPDQAMRKQKAIDANIPKDVPVVMLDKEAPPSQEFAEIAAMLDTPHPEGPRPVQKPSPPVQEEAKVSRPIPQEERKSIRLKYKYEGNCGICNAPIRTIMVQVDNRLFATAYCLTHEELLQIEVHPIKDSVESPDDTKEQLAIPEEAEKKLHITDPLKEIAKRDIRLHQEFLEREREIKEQMKKRTKLQKKHGKTK
jgi:hypothetical protein